jgi:hypothetical protein
MPKILDRLVSQLRAKGKSKKAAYSIAVSALQKSGNLKKGSTKPTSKGIKRGNMSAKDRAIDRESRYSNRSKRDYKYSSKTNRATLKKKLGDLNG